MVRFLYYYIIARHLVHFSKSFEKITSDHSKTMLVLGDSTAVGVGVSDSKDSVAGYLCQKLGLTYVENHSISGSNILDAAHQIKKCNLDVYNIILIQAGANNLTSFQKIKEIESELEILLESLPKHDKIFFVGPADLKPVRLLPWFMRIYFHKKNMEFNTMMIKKFYSLKNSYFVKNYTPENISPFCKNPKVYFSKDMFHPSKEGYEVWGREIIRQYMEEVGKEI